MSAAEALEERPEGLSEVLAAPTSTVTAGQKVLAEMIGTFALVFAGCGAVMVNASTGALGHIGVCVVFGLVVMTVIYAIGHISGAHINPAVTLAFALRGDTPWAEVPLYITAQCLAAMVASYALKALLGPVGSLGATIPTVSISGALVLEFLLTFFLMFGVAAVATDTRARGELGGLVVGAIVMLEALFAGPLTGASMNPARSLGPALASGDVNGLWIYVIAPIAGAVIGAWAYELLRAR